MLLKINKDTVERYSVEGIPFKRRISKAAGDVIRLAAELSEPGKVKEDKAVEALVEIAFSIASEAQLKQWADDALPFEGWLEWVTDRAISAFPLKWGVEKAARAAVKWTYEAMINSGASV